MRKFVDEILSSDVSEAKETLNQYLKHLVDEKLSQVKTRLSAEMADELDEEVLDDDEEEELLDEGIRNVLKTGRTKLVRVRVRKGKVQRRKKLSAVKGWTIRGGKLTRMSPLERRHRKLAARRAKLKRRSKLRQSLRKRSMSLRKRRAMGL